MSITFFTACSTIYLEREYRVKKSGEMKRANCPNNYVFRSGSFSDVSTPFSPFSGKMMNIFLIRN